MKEEDIRKIVPGADKIFVTENGGAYTIGLTVGLFSQAVNVAYNKDSGGWEEQVRNLYQDLKAMNRQVKYQQDLAKRIL